MGEFNLESTIGSALFMRLILITERVHLEIPKPDAMWRFVNYPVLRGVGRYLGTRNVSKLLIDSTDERT